METQGTAAVIKVRVVVIITPEYYFVAVVCCDLCLSTSVEVWRVHFDEIPTGFLRK